MGFFSCTGSGRKALSHICSPGEGSGCGAGVVAWVQTLAWPPEDQGMRCALLRVVGLAQSGDTPALELGAGGAHGQGFPLCSGAPACPVKIGGPSWPTTKSEGHGARLEKQLLPPPGLSRCRPCGVNGIVAGLHQGSNPESLALDGLPGLSLGLFSSSPHA